MTFALDQMPLYLKSKSKFSKEKGGLELQLLYGSAEGVDKSTGLTGIGWKRLISPGFKEAEYEIHCQ